MYIRAVAKGYTAGTRILPQSEISSFFFRTLICFSSHIWKVDIFFSILPAVTTILIEISFSTLKTIKSYIKNSTCENTYRYSDLALKTVHGNIELGIELIVNVIDDRREKRSNSKL